MKVAVFSTKPYDQRFLTAANASAGHEINFFEPRLTPQTAPLADGHDAVCAFVNDDLDVDTLQVLHQGGTRMIALRCAGFNQVNLPEAGKLGMKVARVPAYSPYAVAEHTLGLILCLNRRIHRAFNRVREGNFALEGLLGFDVHGTVAGVVGTGKIGALVVNLLTAFGCKVLCFDPYPNDEVKGMGAEYVELEHLLKESDIISLHCPLTPETHHLINAERLSLMKPRVMLVNTSRGELIDTQAVVAALKDEKVGYLGLDVYEEEGDTFFADHSMEGLKDDVLARLLTFPNVIITGHQAFFTENALHNIAETTIGNLNAFAAGETLKNEVKADG